MPIHAQLAEQLAWLISRGEYAEGDLLPPVRSLAGDLAINFNTVRAAYKQLEAHGLVAVKRGLGTTVLGARRGLSWSSSPRTFTIGVIVPGHTVFYAPFLNALEATDDPSLLFVCNAQQNRDHAGWYLDQLVAKHVDGILVVSTLVQPAETDLGDPRLPPIVFADYPGAPGPVVAVDHRTGSELATKHLIEHGHTRVGFIAPDEALPNVAPKYEGFRDAMAEAGLLPGPISTADDFGIEVGEAAAMRLLDSADRPTAVVTATDNHAIGVMRAASALGLSIPDDVALVGNDDILLADLLDPPLTTIHIPVAEMGRRSMAMLRTLIQGGDLPAAEIVLQPTLVVRSSCGCTD